MSTDSHHFVEAQHFNFHQLELPTPSPSVAESLHYYPQEDIASQQLVTGSYFYSPVSPYSMEGSPAQNTCFGPEFEMGYPPSSLFLKDGNMLMDGSSFISGSLNNALPSPTPSTSTLDPFHLPTTPKPTRSRPPRKRKSPLEKSPRPPIPKLTQPLSILTQGLHHIPVRDMEQWVNRPNETRYAEVRGKDGHISRPMNSFMLYRSAYSERTKIWCLQNNHQVVSSVSGESWPLEPPHIREKYSDLAKRERENHQRAHPGYKFSPSKTLGGKKRKAASPAPAPTDEDQEVELDDIDYLGLHSKRRALNSPAATLMLMGFETGGAQRSSFIHNNPGKTPPQCMAAQDLSGQYYQTTVHAHAAAPIPNPMPNAIIEDVTIRKTQAPVCSSALFQSRNESCFLDSAVKVEELEDNSKVDPALLGMGEEEGGHGQVLFDVFGGGEEFGWGMGMYLENREPWTVEEVDYDEWLSKAGGGC